MTPRPVGSSAPESCGLELEPEAGELGIVAGNSMSISVHT